MATTKMKLRVRKKPVAAAASSTPQPMAAEASPDSKCPICLDKFKNMAYLDLCLHKFCFRCIHEWSKNKAECPLCKQPFNSIFHSIKAQNDFKKYDLRHSERNRNAERRRSPRRTLPPPDNGVLFENLAASASPRQNRTLLQVMKRLAARRRAAKKGRAMHALQDHEMIQFRRALYRRGMRVRNVQDSGRSRDISAEFFRRNPACLHRLVRWLKRELTVLYGEHGYLVSIVQHIIMTQITVCDINDNAIVQDLRPFLQSRTEHFVHEFLNFARSPYNMEAYDLHAVYDCPSTSSSDEDSPSNSPAIVISEDEDDFVGLNSNPNSMSGSTLSHAPWDDETPGPSYSTEPVPTVALSVRDSDSESSVEQADGPVKTEKVPAAAAEASAKAHFSSEEDDCLIVGYVKPLAERTPELVKLSSDSEESVKDDSAAAPKQPQHIRFGSEPSSPAAIDLSKPQPTQRESPRRSDGKGSARNTPEKVRPLCSQEASPSSQRHASSSLALGRHKSHEDRVDRRRRVHDPTRSRSGSPSSSRSHDRSSYSSRHRSRSRSRDRYREGSHPDRRHDRQGTDHSGHGREAASHSYHWHSYSHYSCERDRSRKHYSEKRSSYTSYYVSPDRHSSLQSHSRSRSRSRESRRRERRRSRSHSSTDSASSRRKSKHDKPGGKRKYKTRHLEESAAKHGASKEDSVKDEKSSKDKRRKKSREKSAKRSPSVEIVYEGRSGDQTRRHHKKKKKHKKKSKRHRSKDRSAKHSPVLIILDSDSSHSTEAKGFSLPKCTNSEIDDQILNLSSIVVSPSNPTECLLDPVPTLPQHGEQQPACIDQNEGTNVMLMPDPPSDFLSDEQSQRGEEELSSIDLDVGTNVPVMPDPLSELLTGVQPEHEEPQVPSIDQNVGTNAMPDSPSDLLTAEQPDPDGQRPQCSSFHVNTSADASLDCSLPCEVPAEW